MILLHDIDPIALAVGPLKVHWYGIMYLLGFGLAWSLGRQRIRAGRLPGVSEQAYGDLLFYGMLGVVLGGRLGYVLFYGMADVAKDPMMLVRIWEGGMSFHGGLLGVVVAMLWWARRHRLSFFDVSDFIAPLVPPGLGFGRLGNYIGGELWGKFTHADWGVIFPRSPMDQYTNLPMDQLREAYAQGLLNAYARHPSQLYQAFLEGVLLFVAVWWFSSRPRPRYAVSGLFALIYGLGRFAVEFVRLPDSQLGYLAFGWLTMGQVLSLPLILVGVYWLWRSRRMPTLTPVPAAP